MIEESSSSSNVPTTLSMNPFAMNTTTSSSSSSSTDMDVDSFLAELEGQPSSPAEAPVVAAVVAPVVAPVVAAVVAATPAVGAVSEGSLTSFPKENKEDSDETLQLELRIYDLEHSKQELAQINEGLQAKLETLRYTNIIYVSLFPPMIYYYVDIILC
jgi:hypothetical protein